MGFSLAFPQVESVTIGFSGDILSLHPDPLPALPIDGPDEYSPEYFPYERIDTILSRQCPA